VNARVQCAARTGKVLAAGVGRVEIALDHHGKATAHTKHRTRSVKARERGGEFGSTGLSANERTGEPRDRADGGEATSACATCPRTAHTQGVEISSVVCTLLEAKSHFSRPVEAESSIRRSAEYELCHPLDSSG